MVREVEIFVLPVNFFILAVKVKFCPWSVRVNLFELSVHDHVVQARFVTNVVIRVEEPRHPVDILLDLDI